MLGIAELIDLLNFPMLGLFIWLYWKKDKAKDALHEKIEKLTEQVAGVVGTNNSVLDKLHDAVRGLQDNIRGGQK